MHPPPSLAERREEEAGQNLLHQITIPGRRILAQILSRCIAADSCPVCSEIVEAWTRVRTARVTRSARRLLAGRKSAATPVRRRCSLNFHENNCVLTECGLFYAGENFER